MFRIQLAKHCISPKQKVIATIGNFDGLHLGHLELLEEIAKIGRRENSWRMLITFEALPHEYFADQAETIRAPRIGLLRDKINVLKASNLIDEVVILHFNRYLANWTPDEFTQKILLEKLNITQMVVGHDFHFGYLAKGSIIDLHARGIITHEFAALMRNQVRISSSLIRELSSEQKIEQIRSYLGRNIQYTSRVVYGNQLGRKYGVPTINLNLRRIRPVLWGIYTGYVYIEDIRYNAVVSIGKNPTISDSNIYKVEAHLLGVDLFLYGKIATVEILHYLRPELKFSDLESLFAAIHKDMQDARDFFKVG